MVSLPQLGTVIGARREVGRFRLRLTTLVTVLVAAILVLQWVVVSYSVWRSRADTLEYSAENTARLVQLMETDTARVLQMVRQTFTVARDFIQEDGSLDPRFDYRLNILAMGLLTEAPQIAGFAVLDDSGHAYSMGVGLPGSSNANARDRDFFQVWQDQSETGALFIGQPVQSRMNDRMILPISTAVTAMGRRWVLAVSLDLTELRRHYEGMLRLPSDSASLMRADGIILMRVPYNEAMIGSSIAHGRIISDHLPAADRGTFQDRVAIDGTVRIVSYSRVPDSDLLVVFSLTEDDALRQWRQDVTFNILAFLAINLALVMMAVVILRLVRGAERHNAELARALFAAEGASRAKSSFLANMSHELRTPLNAIIGFGEIMKTETFGPLGSDRYRQYAGHVHDSAHELLSLINEILDLSRIESGKMELEPELFELAEELEFCRTMMERAADRAQVTLSLAVKPPDLTATTDRRAIRRILLNLMSNAVKFTPAGGTVAVTVEGDSRAVTLQVRDTGVGIPADQLQRVLEPFAQVRDVMDRPHTGSGLGLAITRALAEQLGGHFKLDSMLGEGTTATVQFPASISG